MCVCEREEAASKLTASFDTSTKKICLRETRGPYINDEQTNHYTSGLRCRLQVSLQPAAG